MPNKIKIKSTELCQINWNVQCASQMFKCSNWEWITSCCNGGKGWDISYVAKPVPVLCSRVQTFTVEGSHA